MTRRGKRARRTAGLLLLAADAISASALFAGVPVPHQAGLAWEFAFNAAAWLALVVL